MRHTPFTKPVPPHDDAHQRRLDAALDAVESCIRSAVGSTLPPRSRMEYDIICDLGSTVPDELVHLLTSLVPALRVAGTRVDPLRGCIVTLAGKVPIAELKPAYLRLRSVVATRPGMYVAPPRLVVSRR